MTGVAPAATEDRWARPEARWKDVIRPYTKEDVERLRGTVKIEYTLARLGAERLWKLLHEEDYVPALGAMTGWRISLRLKRNVAIWAGRS